MVNRNSSICQTEKIKKKHCRESREANRCRSIKAKPKQPSQKKALVLRPEQTTPSNKTTRRTYFGLHQQHSTFLIAGHILPIPPISTAATAVKPLAFGSARYQASAMDTLRRTLSRRTPSQGHSSGSTRAWQARRLICL
jgi:hypothetical protein